MSVIEYPIFYTFIYTYSKKSLKSSGAHSLIQTRHKLQAGLRVSQMLTFDI